MYMYMHIYIYIYAIYMYNKLSICKVPGLSLAASDVQRQALYSNRPDNCLCSVWK